jgi:hypothetical protein
VLEHFTADQPSVQGLIERACTELSAKAVLLLHENGQVLQKSGWIDDNEYPAMAALIAAMIAAGKGIGNLSDSNVGSPSRFACDSEAAGLYTVGVAHGIWLSVLYDQPLNPGQFRMKVRRYSELLARLGVQQPEQWELPQNGTASMPEDGATLRPVSSREATTPEILTAKNSSLFANISDTEIDELFENARS